MNNDLERLRKLAVMVVNQEQPMRKIAGLINQVNTLQDQFTSEHPAYGKY